MIATTTMTAALLVLASYDQSDHENVVWLTASNTRRKPLGGRPRAIIRPSTTLNSVRKQQGIDAMRREQQAKGRAAPQALPTGKCEC